MLRQCWQHWNDTSVIPVSRHWHDTKTTPTSIEYIFSIWTKWTYFSNFGQNFEKSSFLPKMKIHQFLPNLKKSSFLQKFEKSSILAASWKIIIFCQNLKNHPFLLKFENSSFYSKIWKISSVVSVLPTLQHWKDTGVFSVVV